jgi:hypothetical protein
MRAARLGFSASAVGLMTAMALPTAGTAAQATPLRATISPQVVVPTGAPVAASVDPCVISASGRQIEVVVTDPQGEVLSDWFYTPPDAINEDGTWSLAIRMTDDSGQPTTDPFPELGTYTVQVSCVSTYLPRVIKPYQELRFEVVDHLPTPTTPPVTTPPAPAPPAVPEAPPAVPVEAEADFTG